MTAAAMYAAMFDYLVERGWTRTNQGEGWWWHERFNADFLIGEAVGEQLADEGVDVRENPGRPS